MGEIALPHPDFPVVKYLDRKIPTTPHTYENFREKIYWKKKTLDTEQTLMLYINLYVQFPDEIVSMKQYGVYKKKD